MPLQREQKCVSKRANMFSLHTHTPSRSKKRAWSRGRIAGEENAATPTRWNPFVVQLDKENYFIRRRHASCAPSRSRDCDSNCTFSKCHSIFHCSQLPAVCAMTHNENSFGSMSFATSFFVVFAIIGKYHRRYSKFYSA